MTTELRRRDDKQLFATTAAFPEIEQMRAFVGSEAARRNLDGIHLALQSLVAWGTEGARTALMMDDPESPGFNLIVDAVPSSVISHNDYAARAFRALLERLSPMAVLAAGVSDWWQTTLERNIGWLRDEGKGHVHLCKSNGGLDHKVLRTGADDGPPATCINGVWRDGLGHHPRPTLSDAFANVDKGDTLLLIVHPMEINFGNVSDHASILDAFRDQIMDA